MRRCLVALATLTLSPYAQALEPPIKVTPKVTITSHDGTLLDAALIEPRDPMQTPQASHPVIVLLNSWIMDKHEYYIPAMKWAESGYTVLSYSARGWGRSQGVIGMAGEPDIKDASYVIDWLEQHLPHKNLSIGMAGVSYGGGISLLAAAHEPRIQAVVAMSSWSSIPDTFYPNQTPNMAWVTLLGLTGKIFGRLDPTVWRHYDNLMNQENIEETMAWGRARSPQTYIKLYNKRQVPIYISSNTSDHLFNPNPMLKFYGQLTGPKQIDLNNGAHAAAEIPGLAGAPSYLWERAKQWFDQHLTAQSFKTTSSSHIQVKNTKKRVPLALGLSKHSPSFFLQAPSNKHGELLPHSATQTAYLQIRSHLDSFATTGIPIASDYFDTIDLTPVRTLMSSIHSRYGRRFLSPPLKSNLLVRGRPQLELSVVPDQEVIQLVVYLYDVAPNNWGTLITHAPITRVGLVPGEELHLKLELLTAAYDIPKNHRLGLIIDTQDPLYKKPGKKPFTLTMLIGGAYPAKLSLP